MNPVEQRRKSIEDLVRYNEYRTINEIKDALGQVGLRLAEETVRRDLDNIGAMKDTRSGFWVLADQAINRYDLYDMLRHSIHYLMHDVATNDIGNTIFLYCDLGTSRRFSHILEALRQDERLNRARGWYDNILAVHASQDDTVIIHFRNGRDGKKFLAKIKALQKQGGTYDFENAEEKAFMDKLGRDTR
jgi:arginine repressor